MNAIIDKLTELPHLPELVNIEAPWMQTKSGRAFPLWKPQPSDVLWSDVIYHLAHINRFSGAVGIYSVAQHSIVVADQLSNDIRLYGLLHDAHEAYIGDIIRPTVEALEWHDYVCGDVRGVLRRLKDDIDSAIYIAAGLEYPVPERIASAVHVADLRALVTEQRDLMKAPSHPWTSQDIPPLNDTIVAWRSPSHSIAKFALALGDAGLDGVFLPRQEFMSEIPIRVDGRLI